MRRRQRSFRSRRGSEPEPAPWRRFVFERRQFHAGREHAGSDDTAASTPASTNGVLLDTSFGVKGDGSTNDRAALQRAIDGSVGQILLITGKSRIDAAGLTLRTNSHVRFASGASIKLLSHNTETYEIMRLCGRE